MREKVKVEVEIPAPPKSWGEVEFRTALPGDVVLDINGVWQPIFDATDCKLLAARRVTPLWTPPPQWHALLGNCWLTRNINNDLRVHKTKPDKLMGEGVWECDDYEFYIPTIRPELCPPDDIPWHKCCFKIGDPQE